MATAITVEGVGKRYYLGLSHGGAFSQRLDNAVKAPYRWISGRRAPEPQEEKEEFWALRDCSLEVEQGEVVGLVGANGAGKSTLLKMLARVTTPTEGRITLNGTVGSLLEVGTGFHPELTGRENVFLNGAILGMRRVEIAQRYDEIVEFSGVQRFIETPVKRYSSGMFVRLAFAVAVHLKPEILLLDEVLAVGDAAFQRKCLAKMEEIRQTEGRTIVYVSHNMASVRKLCDRVALFEDGRLTAEGPTDAIAASYLERTQPLQHGGVAVIPPDVMRSGSGAVRMRHVSVLDDDGEPIEKLRYGQSFTVAVEVEARERVDRVVYSAIVSSPDGLPILVSNSTDSGGPVHSLKPGVTEVRARIEATLLPHEFVLDVAVKLSDGKTLDCVERVLGLTVIRDPVPGETEYPWQASHGLVRANAQWKLPVEQPLVGQGS